MKYPRMLCVLSIFVIMGTGIVAFCPINVDAEEWVKSYEAFKPAGDPAYHQRHTGNIEWHLFHDTPADETKTDEPKYTDIYWIEGDKGWEKRIKAVEGTSRLRHMTPGSVDASKYQSPCPLCEDPTYFWLSAGDMDSDTERHVKGDFPGWSIKDGICLNCFECYQLRAGKFYDGKAASSTDEYVIGYDKSPGVLDYFRNVK